MKGFKSYLVSLFLGALALFSINTQAAIWQSTAVEVIHGTEFKQGNDGASGSDMTFLTLDHSHAWKYGSSWFFVDAILDGGDDVDLYLEFFPSLSMEKVFKKDFVNMGWLQDISLGVGFGFGNVDNLVTNKILGASFNFATNTVLLPDTADFYYGGVLEFKIPNFTYFNIGMYAVDDFNSQTDYDLGWQITPAWSLPIWVGDFKFKFEGYADFRGARDFGSDGLFFGTNTTTGKQAGQDFQIFSQMQLLWDAGFTAYGKAGQLFVGTEVQWTHNTFGVQKPNDSDEFFPSIMVEWNF